MICIIKFNKASKRQFWVCAGYVARLSSAGAVPRDEKGDEQIKPHKLNPGN